MSLKTRLKRLEGRRPPRPRFYWPDDMGLTRCPIGKDAHGQYFDRFTGEQVRGVIAVTWDGEHGETH